MRDAHRWTIGCPQIRPAGGEPMHELAVRGALPLAERPQFLEHRRAHRHVVGVGEVVGRRTVREDVVGLRVLIGAEQLQRERRRFRVAAVADQDRDARIEHARAHRSQPALRGDAIGVRKGDDRRPRAPDAGVARGVGASRRLVQQDNLRIPLDCRSGPISRAIVDKDDFDRTAGALLCQQGFDAGIEMPMAVDKRHHHRDTRRLGRRLNHGADLRGAGAPRLAPR